jgi:iron-sulfur cluster insertion protein
MSEFHVTSAAAQRIAHLLKDEPALAMRVGVLGGGCSGFQYEFSFAKAREPDDIVFEAAD